MLNIHSLENILFLDIETVPMTGTYEEAPEKFRDLWDTKAKFLAREGESPSEIFRRAGIYAEFGKVICISAGFIFGKENPSIKIKSFYGDDERQILLEFAELLNTRCSKPGTMLCAHNGKEFDFPFLSRRMLINGIPLPSVLNVHGKKPWETNFLDTMELWKFGDYKNYTSLETLATVFNIPTPKDDIKGSDVWRVYWQEKDLDRIMTYCQKDVVCTMQLFLKYNCLPLIPSQNIFYAEPANLQPA